MTASKITALTALTSTQVASGDSFVLVDVSATSMAASGTNRKMTADEVGKSVVSLRGASPTVTFTTAQGAGTATTLLRSDAVLKVFSTAAPQSLAVGSTASKGTAAFAARIDHVHAMPASTAIWATKKSLHTSTASLTLALTDAGKIIEMNKATTNSVTVPSSSSVNFSVGTQIDIVQYGAGATTIVAGTTGVSIRHTTSVGLSLASQYAGATLYKRAANEWVAVGNLKSS